MVSETVAGIGATVSTRVGATVGDRSAMVPAAEGPAEGGTIDGTDATATGSFLFHQPGPQASAKALLILLIVMFEPKMKIRSASAA